VGMKDIKDYLYLYLGCEAQYSSHHEPQNERYLLTASNLQEAIEFEDMPILRPLSDITTEEQDELSKTYLWVQSTPVHAHLRTPTWTSESVRYLLSKGFDLFGLIESGLAINKQNYDRTKTQNTNLAPGSYEEL
jgi:hypothetical protein